MKGRDGFYEQVLENGLRVVVEPMPHVRSAAAGFLVRTGSRDETPEVAGVSHFLEHMCFKGTPRRTWRQITEDFDRIGSTYNAFTSKERTFYFGWVRTEDLERQIELLADMMCSILPPDEFEIEKKVILEEIAMSEDQIDHCVYELLHERCFAGHSLSWPVLGTTQSVSALTREQMHSYFTSRYHPANMVLIVAGAVEPPAAVELARRYCGDWEPRLPRPQRQSPSRPASGEVRRRNERFGQQALALAFPAPSGGDADRETADVLAAILGGHNSRFFWKIIQAGIAPHVAAGRMDYSDNGLMVAFGFCEPAQAPRLLDAMRAEIARLYEGGVSEDEVQRVKNRVRTALATEAEAPYYRLMQLVGDIDVLGAPRSVAERLAAVDAVSPGGIRKYLEDWPMTGDGFLVSLGPADEN